MTLAAAIDLLQESVCGLKSAQSSRDTHTSAEINAQQDLSSSYLLILVGVLLELFF